MNFPLQILIMVNEQVFKEKLSVAAFDLSLSSTYKASVFSEINRVLPYFLSLKIFRMERSSGSQS